MVKIFLFPGVDPAKIDLMPVEPAEHREALGAILYVDTGLERSSCCKAPIRRTVNCGLKLVQCCRCSGLLEE